MRTEIRPFRKVGVAYMAKGGRDWIRRSGSAWVLLHREDNDWTTVGTFPTVRAAVAAHQREFR